MDPHQDPECLQSETVLALGRFGGLNCQMVRPEEIRTPTPRFIVWIIRIGLGWSGRTPEPKLVRGTENARNTPWSR
jgi:hypothetical protein